MKALPKGWEWTTVGDVADIQLGRQRSPKNHSGPYMRPYLRSANVTWGGIDISDVKAMNFEPPEALAFELAVGDLLLNEASGSPNEVGKPAIWKGEIDGCCFQNTILRVRTRGPRTDYLYWLCKYSALTGRFGEACRGVNIRHLGKHGLAVFQIPLPPMTEQERIVAAIEEHLSRLDAAERSLVAAESRIARLRQALIDDAIEGRPEQLASLLREPLRNGVSARASATGRVKVVTLTAVTRNEFIDSHTKMIDEGGRISDDLWMEPGDIFVQRSNTPELVGTASQYRGPKGWATFPDLLIRVRVGERAIPDYVELVLHSSRIRRYLQGSAQGIAGSMPKISQPIVASTEIPLSSVDRQREIVNRVSAELEAARRMGGEVTAARARQRSLRRAILAAAFSGQLVPQDPDDEPASALLDRIRAGRPDDKPGSRRRQVKAGA